MRLTGAVVVCEVCEVGGVGGGELEVMRGFWIVGGIGEVVGVPDGVEVVVEVLERQVLLGAGDIVLQKNAGERCLHLSEGKSLCDDGVSE